MYKSMLQIYVSTAILLITVHCVTADVSDNEVSDQTYMVQGVKVYPGDRECVLVGGLCVHKSDCLEPTTKLGLCGSNSHLGVECCYEIPVMPAPCAQHFGECMPRCNKDLMRPSTDCENDQVCCVLV